jgi:hypothetical protein
VKDPVCFNTILEEELMLEVYKLGLVRAECQCAPKECTSDINNIAQCKNCIIIIVPACNSYAQEYLSSRQYFTNLDPFFNG